MSDFPTITEAEAYLPQAKKVAVGMGIPEDDAPLFLGLISTDPPSEATMERGRELAARYGW